ncbi:MAG: TraR/DksA family transcriptional regulator [Rhizobacter sp.]
MNQPVSKEQKVALAHALQVRRQALERQMALHQHDQTRVEFARDLLLQDGDDAPQRASDREVDQTLSDLDLRVLAAVAAAQGRLERDAYGQCIDCEEPIPFERLLIEPEAERCLACQSTHETSRA